MSTSPASVTSGTSGSLRLWLRACTHSATTPHAQSTDVQKNGRSTLMPMLHTAPACGYTRRLRVDSCVSMHWIRAAESWGTIQSTVAHTPSRADRYRGAAFRTLCHTGHVHQVLERQRCCPAAQHIHQVKRLPCGTETAALIRHHLGVRGAVGRRPLDVADACRDGIGLQQCRKHAQSNILSIRRCSHHLRACCTHRGGGGPTVGETPTRKAAQQSKSTMILLLHVACMCGMRMQRAQQQCACLRV